MVRFRKKQDATNKKDNIPNISVALQMSTTPSEII